MDKVIVERPRWRSGAPARKKGYRKYIASTPQDQLPKREPMLGRWCGLEKLLNEHLGPMRRFLRSNIGRPWNHVHRELCEHISFRNPVQAHVLEHIDEYVTKHVYLENGDVYSQASHWPGGNRLHIGDMYVCPATGILRAVRKPKSRDAQMSRLDVGSVKLFRREGIWWELRFQAYPADPGLQYDIWLERPLTRLTPEECNFIYGEQAFVISKRQLSEREFKRLKRQMDNEQEKSSRHRDSR